MPYINASSRTKLDGLIGSLSQAIADEFADPQGAAGALNYTISRLMVGTLDELDVCRKYWHIALMTGVLENAKQELYRRIASPFEDGKRDLNGDIPEYEQ